MVAIFVYAISLSLCSLSWVNFFCFRQAGFLERTAQIGYTDIYAISSIEYFSFMIAYG